MAFHPKHIDFTLSPYTGLTRESWIEAGQYMLEGIFQHIKGEEDPVVVPRQENKVTYPHPDSDEKKRVIEEKAEMFEGLTRSFFIAAPLIHIDPHLNICGRPMCAYYKNQILRSCTANDPHFVGTYEELQKTRGNNDPFCTFQQTVESCALVIGLWACKEELWDTYTREQKDTIAAFLSSYAHANTVPQNWRLFNMLDMAFLHQEGYPIDKEIMLDHAQAILDYYVGDGWYRDGHSFDYYSCWAFQFYAPLWNLWYGYENEPYIAQKFEEYSNRLMDTYADFFDEDGYTNMWGRSNIYRFAATCAFDGNLLLKRSTVDPGRARRIASGSLLQFLGRDDFTWKGIPTLGFYKQFVPLVQGYSCAESPFWMGKAFLCLHLPKDHAFWTAQENNGTWERLKGIDVKETVLNGPALAFTNHKANGETILRTGKVLKRPEDKSGMWNYAKLCYNTKYPWESTPVSPQEEKTWNMESQQYVLTDVTTQSSFLANAVFWCGERQGILYRRLFFDYCLEHEMHWRQGMYLADFPVAHGILRVDKMKLYRRPVQITLGAYGFPDNHTIVTEETEILNEEDTANVIRAKAIVLNGCDAVGRARQLAMTIYDGWDDMSLIHSTGSNPDSEHSIIIYARTQKNKQYGGKESYVMISQVITKESNIPFTREELFPIQNISYTDAACRGTYGPVEITLKSGKKYIVDYECTEHRMSL